MATRKERVVLELDDQFTTGMMKAAVATATLDKALRKLDGSGVRVNVSVKETVKDLDAVEQKMKKSGVEIDRYSGRLRLIGEAVAVLGPGLVPLGAVAIPAVTGLAQQLGFAAVAGGTFIAAFQGVGDALKAVNTAALEPTTANLEKAEQAMADLSPAAQDFVGRLRDFIPALKQLRDSSAEGIFPGVTEAMDSLEEALPRFDRVVSAIATATGDIIGDAGESLAGDRWAEFIDYLGTDGPEALSEMASAVGNVTHAMAELWMAFDPLNDDFSGWLVKATADLDKWAAGLSQTQGFQDFVDYIRTSGPQVADTLGALGTALVDIITAAAPLGGVVLAGLEGVFNVISAIAGSDLGTPIMAGVAALALWNRTMTISAGLSKRMEASGGLLGGFASDRKSAASSAIKGAKADIADLAATWATAGARTERESARVAKSTASLKSNLGSLAKEGVRAGAPIAALGVLSTGAADSIGLTNTATLGLLGTMAGPWGAAAGATVGLFMDLKASGDAFAQSLDAIDQALAAGDLEGAAGGLDKLQSKLDDWSDPDGFRDAVSDIFAPIGAWASGDVNLDGWWGVKLSDEAQKTADAVAKARSEVNFFGATDFAAGLGDSLSGIISGLDGAADSAAEFRIQLSLAQNALAARGSVDAYRSSLFALEDSLKKNGAAFSEHSRKGLENREALFSVAASALEASKSMKGFGRDNFLDRARDDFIRMAVAAGATRRQAASLATEFGLLDTIKVRPKVEEMGSKASQKRVADLRREIRETKSKMVNMDEKGAAAARARIARMRSEIAALRDRTVTVTMNQITNKITRFISNSPIPFGEGNRGMLITGGVRKYARGGMDIANRHQPELAGPGMTRIWREPETGGEAYIPLKNDDRRPRARAIAAETVALLGGVATFDQGGSVYDKAAQTQAASTWTARSQTPALSLAGMRVTGTLDTEWGEAVIEGIVEDRMASRRSIDDKLARMGKSR